MTNPPITAVLRAAVAVPSGARTQTTTAPGPNPQLLDFTPRVRHGAILMPGTLDA